MSCDAAAERRSVCFAALACPSCRASRRGTTLIAHATPRHWGSTAATPARFSPSRPPIVSQGEPARNPPPDSLEAAAAAFDAAAFSALCSSRTDQVDDVNEQLQERARSAAPPAAALALLPLLVHQLLHLLVAQIAARRAHAAGREQHGHLVGVHLSVTVTVERFDHLRVRISRRRRRGTSTKPEERRVGPRPRWRAARGSVVGRHGVLRGAGGLACRPVPPIDAAWPGVAGVGEAVP